MIALLLALQLAATPACPARYPVSSTLRVYDGDTYRFRVELGFDVSVAVDIRLSGLDTDERNTDRGKVATAAVVLLFNAGAVTVTPTGDRTFARWVGVVCVGTQNVADWLRANGHEKRPQPKE